MRLIRYFFVGGAAATVDIGLFSIFANILGFSWLPVSICTFLLGPAIKILD